MATTDGADKIVTKGVQNRRRRLVGYGRCDGTIWHLETPMDTVWPSGDPVPRDRETLVEILTRRVTVE